VLAETTLAHGPTARAGGERYHVVVHIDVQTLADAAGRKAGEQSTAPPSVERCALEDGTALAAETVRRLACDASLSAILHGPDGGVLDVGRRTRAIPAALRRALQARDDGCRFPSCTARRFVDGHHVRHWADGGATSLRNLVTLCRHHHRLVHEAGFTVERAASGEHTFRGRDGRPIPAANPLPGGSPGYLPAVHARLGLAITPDSLIPDWDGRRPDYDFAVAVLYQASHPASSA
jgi:Domain of unknown function (DUF222)/HNH endonuclease